MREECLAEGGEPWCLRRDELPQLCMLSERALHDLDLAACAKLRQHQFLFNDEMRKDRALKFLLDRRPESGLIHPAAPIGHIAPGAFFNKASATSQYKRVVVLMAEPMEAGIAYPAHRRIAPIRVSARPKIGRASHQRSSHGTPSGRPR